MRLFSLKIILLLYSGLLLGTQYYHETYFWVWLKKQLRRRKQVNQIRQGRFRITGIVAIIHLFLWNYNMSECSRYCLTIECSNGKIWLVSTSWGKVWVILVTLVCKYFKEGHSQSRHESIPQSSIQLLIWLATIIAPSSFRCKLSDMILIKDSHGNVQNKYKYGLNWNIF